MNRTIVFLLFLSSTIFSQNFLKVDSIDEKLIKLTYNDEYNQVKSICDSLIKKDKKNPKYYFHYFSADALELHEKINLFPLNGRDSLQEILVNKSINKLESAIKELDDIKMTPTNRFYIASLHGYYSRFAGLNRNWWAAYVNGTKANDMFEDIIKEYPECYDAYLYPGVFKYYAARLNGFNGFIASILGVSGNRNDGLNYINKAFKNSKLVYPQTLLMLMEINTVMEDNPNKAIPYFEEFVKIYPKNKRVINWYGHTILNLYQTKKFGDKIKSDKFGVIDNYVKTKYFYLTNQLDSAIKCAKLAFQKPKTWKGIIDHTKYYYIYSNWLKKNSEISKSYKSKLDDFYTKLFELDLKNEAQSEYIYELTTILGNGNYSEFNNKLSQKPKFTEKHFIAEFNLLQGISLFQQNKLSESLSYFEKAEETPDERNKTIALRYQLDVYLKQKMPTKKVQSLIERIEETDFNKLIFRLDDLKVKLQSHF